MKSLILAAGLTAAATMSFEEAESYTLDPSHSQIVFSYNHLGFSTNYGMFSGFGGDIQFDQANQEKSSVSVSMPARSMLTGLEARFNHFMGADFFSADDDETISFVSNGIEVIGENTAKITGDLTVNEVTKSVVLDAKLNQAAEHPMAGVPFTGFDATAEIKRSDFGLGQFAPFVSDEVQVWISIEAMKEG